MDNRSIWEDIKKKEIQENRRKLEEDKSIVTDILIIGGGITGMSTAYFLMNSDKKMILIDKGSIGMGVTCKTTAKLNYLQGIIYQQLEKNFNREISKLYLDSQMEAIELIKKIIELEKINCDLEKCNSFIFTKENKGIEKIKKEKEILESFGVNSKEVEALPIHFPIKYGIMVSNTYTFHPLKYIESLRKKVQKKIDICENTIALEITKEQDIWKIKTNQGTINSKYVVVACHYPFFLFPGLVPIKTYIKREYVNASKFDLTGKPFTAVSIDPTLHSIRFYQDYIVYGSNQHRLTNKIRYQDNYIKSRNDFTRLFSKQPEYTWMNQDIISNDNLPIIGIMDKNKPNLLIATAFGAWGMTNGTIAGKILADIILEQTNKYFDLFQPQRINITNIIKSAIGALHYSKVYAQTTIKKNPIFENNQVYIIKINGKYYGIYYDENGKKHIVNHKCPHMKCNLVFNNQEKTWDCPCHGSRFDIDGNVIEGPANYSIHVNFEKE